MQLKQLGPYRLGRKLGQGGMGAVFQGVDDDTGQSAAVKVLSPHLAGEEGFRVRFEAEIESLKKLNHPNIVRLYGYGEQDSWLFYAMELVDGTSLEEELRAGRRFQWREVTQLTVKICRALKHAHDHGVIHRDIKPANLLLASTGEIKLSDFGIARLFGNTRLTSDGGLLGTAEYMAPEQADGRPVTDRCDQYSLGGVMYALLAGRPPFKANTLVEMLQLQRFSEPDPVRRFASDTPAELDRIIQQLLAKDPQKRFSNAAILARSLEAMERGLSLSPERDDFIVPGIDLPATGVAIDPTAQTLVPSDLPPVSKARVRARRPGDSSIHNEVGATSLHIGTVTGRTPAPGVRTEQAPRFTKVEEHGGEQPAWQREAWAAVTSWHTWAAALALIGLVGGAWLAFQPPSADRLIEQISEATASKEAGAATTALGKMERFLTLYPDDPRADEVQQQLAEITERKNERKLDREGRGLNRPGDHTPVERAYREALALKAAQPSLALAHFRALVDLYGRRSADDQEEAWVTKARDEVKLLEKRVVQDEREDLLAIEQQLRVAAGLKESDPAAARQIWQAVIALYGDKPWAATVVGQARDALQDTETPR